ncbi:MAG: chlorophyll synthase ChlG [Alphaproteobacteria bacterium]|nr:chlorophyll synthase ChlG [Alphaproteobacteria bacterium]
MARSAAAPSSSLPQPRAVLELLKPITWFPPMWAFACGVVSAGAVWELHWGMALAGVILAGPLLCAASQAVNDWYDRHVDAINEPDRPIPSGRVPGRWGLYIAIAWSALALAWAAAMGVWIFLAASLGVLLSWLYSAPPARLKRSGWLGPAAVALSYEGVAWYAGAAAVLAAAPRWEIIAIALLYSIGAHGIMTLNDFKAIEGDRATGVRSLPVTLGVDRAAQLACVMMIAPQIVAGALLAAWGAPFHAALIGALVAAQALLCLRLVRDPRRFAPWYNGSGVLLSVLGMMVCAAALAGLGG